MVALVLLSGRRCCRVDARSSQSHSSTLRRDNRRIRPKVVCDITNMAYRGVKGSDPFVSKTSRNERFAQMSKQEQIIQQKKLEIQAKMQEQKAKEAVESMRKTSAMGPNSMGSKSNATKKEEEKPVASHSINLFANDGSFLDQFKKIACNRGAGRVDAMFAAKGEEKEDERYGEGIAERDRCRNTDRNREWENRKDRRREDVRWEKNMDKRRRSPSTPSPTRHPTCQSPEARRPFGRLPSDAQHAQRAHEFHSRNGNSSVVPPVVCQPVLHLAGVPPPSMRDIITSVPPPNLGTVPPPKSMHGAYPGLEDRPGDPRRRMPSPCAVRPPPPPPPPPPLSMRSIPPDTSMPPPNMHISRTVSSGLQSLPPPPPPPPIPLPIPASSSTLTLPASSASSLLLSSSSSSTASCSASSASSFATPGLQLPPPLGSLSSPSTQTSSASSSSSSAYHPSSLPSSSLSCSSSIASSLSSSSSTPSSTASSSQLPLLASSSSTPSTVSSGRPHMLPSGQQCGVPALPAPQPTNLPPPNIPPPNLLSSMTQMPTNMMPMSGAQTIVVTVPNGPNGPSLPNLPNMSNVPSVIPAVIMSAPPPGHKVASSISSVPPPNLNVPPPNIPPPSMIQNPGPAAPPPPPPPPPGSGPGPAPLMSTSYPLPSQIAQVPMGPPNVQVPPPVRPLTGLRASDQLEAEQLARIVADCGDEIEQEAREKNAQEPKLWFLHQKQSAAYLQYRGLVAKFRAEKSMKGNKSSGAEPYCPEEALSDNEDSDQASLPNRHASLQERKREKAGENDPSGRAREDRGREERKRKRRSRWGDPENKVSITETSALTGRRKQQGGSGFSQPGIAIPGQIGQPAVIIPSAKVQRTEAKNPMLTKISRNDPALAQYARQTFGTLDLTEEQWKKAEDHYKINLLYQNLLRKREEVRRLEAQGKHKYEYDSDEETEGGTWEHKLRSAEMEATQMWAEELTAQAEGKHHIGDFLPPDELKKFMEQYNAVKQGKEPDLSDYKEYKLKGDNIGFQMLQKLGWSEGQGLGSEGNGRIEPINKATNRFDSAGLGSERPDGVSRDDDEFDAYRKRMMLAYRFRPNPLNNPRRPYY